MPARISRRAKHRQKFTNVVGGPKCVWWHPPYNGMPALSSLPYFSLLPSLPPPNPSHLLPWASIPSRQTSFPQRSECCCKVSWRCLSAVQSLSLPLSLSLLSPSCTNLEGSQTTMGGVTWCKRDRHDFMGFRQDAHDMLIHQAAIQAAPNFWWRQGTAGQRREDQAVVCGACDRRGQSEGGQGREFGQGKGLLVGKGGGAGGRKGARQAARGRTA